MKARKRRHAKKYSAEFRERAVKLVQQYPEKSVKEIADELGMNRFTLSGWLRSSESEHGTVAPPGETLEEKVKRLERENAMLREEREILKKAATFFAKESE
jgi:transposase-like protein